MKRDTKKDLAVLACGFAVLAASHLWATQSVLGQEEPPEIRTAKKNLETQEKTFGAQHPSIVTNLNHLARLFVSRGELEKAEPLLKRALVINEKALGPKHSNTANSLHNLADIESDDALAEKLYQRALAIRERVLGPEHPECADTLNNLAELYLQMGKQTRTKLYLERAEPLLRRALKIREKVFGREHRDIVQSLSNLARCYHSQGKKAQAEALFQHAADMAEKLGLEQLRDPTNRRELPRGRKLEPRGTQEPKDSHQPKSL